MAVPGINNQGTRVKDIDRPGYEDQGFRPVEGEEYLYNEEENVYIDPNGFVIDPFSAVEDTDQPGYQDQGFVAVTVGEMDIWIGTGENAGTFLNEDGQQIELTDEEKMQVIEALAETEQFKVPGGFNNRLRDQLIMDLTESIDLESLSPEDRARLENILIGIRDNSFLPESYRAIALLNRLNSPEGVENEQLANIMGTHNQYVGMIANAEGDERAHLIRDAQTRILGMLASLDVDSLSDSDRQVLLETLNSMQADAEWAVQYYESQNMGNGEPHYRLAESRQRLESINNFIRQLGG